VNTAAVWVLVACFGQYCLGADSRVVAGLTRAQCEHLLLNYTRLKASGLPPAETKDFRLAECVGPNPIEGDIVFEAQLSKAIERPKPNSDNSPFKKR
jgi:hypothetical protein